MALEQVTTFVTSKMKNMMYSFYGCTNLIEIGGLDTSQIISVSELFYGCKSLRKIGGRLDFGKVTLKIDTTFVSCAALGVVAFTGTIGVDISVIGSPKLMDASLLSLLKALSPEISGKTCYIGSRYIIKLMVAQ